MNANDLPDEIPEHLRTDANATLLEQVAMDLAESDTDDIEDAIEARIKRNRKVARASLES